MTVLPNRQPDPVHGSPQPEIVIPLHVRDIGTAARTFDTLRRYVRPAEITVITGSESSSDPRLAGCRVLDEDKLVPGMTLDAVRRKMEEYDIPKLRSPGWLLQQFLKLGYARTTPHTGYIIWDSDTIPTKRFDFFSERDGRPFLFGKTENFPPYYELNRRVLGLENRRLATQLGPALPSFVAEVMYMRTDLVNEMLDEVETRTGLPFWEGIISVMDANSIPAEFEMYGNFVCQRYPDQYIITEANFFRFAAKLVGVEPTSEQMAWLSQDFDVISLESYHERKFFSKLTRSPIVRRIASARRICTTFNAVATPLVKTKWTGSKYFYF
ncbi:hypothetical protein FDO65_17720 [Nakamurella flava]|uniref:Uncharacterized protein n=1 Tax=Nakamurella flava TaxID=2576308 RepID=A0A4U6QBH1_9ACTN|nr:DUF6492 family protein [Nakamurella flava]TKV57363.1 hypothetical protein FDO65_17720 [Nakamurella flava]